MAEDSIVIGPTANQIHALRRAERLFRAGGSSSRDALVTGWAPAPNHWPRRNIRVGGRQ
jgi:hypothetical protein